MRLVRYFHSGAWSVHINEETKQDLDHELHEAMTIGRRQSVSEPVVDLVLAAGRLVVNLSRREFVNTVDR